MRKTLISAAMCLLLLAGYTACIYAETEKYADTDFVMDTTVMTTLYTSGDDVGPELVERIRAEEENILSWTIEGSELYEVNHHSEETMTISEELAGYLARTFAVAEDSDGALDPTMGEVIRLWDIGGEDPHVPEKEALAEAMAHRGLSKVSLDGRSLTLPEESTLDLGSVGKGIACDLAGDFFRTKPEISGALVSMGTSSVMTYGTKPDGTSWNVAVRDPEGNIDDYIGIVALAGEEYLSTSGDYEKFFEEDGIRYHHILDPATGYPCDSGLSSVTVVCGDGLEADALSTACMVLGAEQGTKLLEKYGADGLFLDHEGSIMMTEGMKNRFTERK
ncbi:MAG: FAD:protein FMN transferase [Blautia sp.]|nr:FAD:protein FMN transferase [Blautia sp.]